MKSIMTHFAYKENIIKTSYPSYLRENTKHDIYGQKQNLSKEKKPFKILSFTFIFLLK